MAQTSTKNNNTAPKKKSRRRMKKQVRRTFAGLLMATAIAVAAIPVDNLQASSATPMETAEDTGTGAVNLVRTLNRKQGNNTYETLSGSDATWQSGVPYLNITTVNEGSVAADGTVTEGGIASQGDYIYINEDQSIYFAYVQPEPTAVSRAVVIVGIDNTALNNGTLTIPRTIDAYRPYNVNSNNNTSPVAVTGDGSYLYYPNVVQETDNKDYLKYSAEIYNLKSKSASPGFRDKTITLDENTKKKIYIYVNPTTPNDSTKYYTDESGTLIDASSYGLSLTFDSSKTLTSVTQAYEIYDNELDENKNIITTTIDNGDGTTTTQNVQSWQAASVTVTASAETKNEYSPCYLKNKASWTDSNGDDKQLYYWDSTDPVDKTDSTKFKAVNSTDTDADKQRIHDVNVSYIGMQSLTSVSYYVKGDDGEAKTVSVWTVKEPTTSLADDGTLTKTPTNGVFYGNANLTALNLAGDDPNSATDDCQLLGIGDYAFYLTGLQSITLTDSINTIGNGAFAGCSGLKSVSMPDNANLFIIGASAFEDCTSLTSFRVPHAVRAIGDRAFRGDYSMTTIEMNYDPTEMNLQTIGYNAFENCSGLTSIEFPKKLEQKIPIHYFKGCTGLTYIKTNNDTCDIVDGDPRYSDLTKKEDQAHTAYHNVDGSYCDIDEFLKTAPKSFYFYGDDTSAIHKTAKDHSATFKFNDTDWAGYYEIVSTCDETAKHESSYVVDTNGNLVNVDINTACSEIRIPDAVGEFGITTISSSTFQNNCSLKRIYIPSTITYIASGAFNGCHNLTDVIFTGYQAGLTIEDGAFDTQAIVADSSSSHVCNKCKADIGTSAPTLTFSGTIDEAYAPFKYAMNPDNNINASFQPKTYITYYSGWPELLTVQYNPDRASTGDENELVDYPKFETISAMVNMGETACLAKYPFMDKDDFAALTNVYHYIAPKTDSENYSISSEDEVTLANSLTNLTIPSGIESIKSGLFSDLDSDGNPVSGTTASPNTKLKQITTTSVKNIEPYALSGMTGLETFIMNNGSSIGDYAFYNDTALKTVSISPTVSSIGIRPFRTCSALKTVDFSTSPYFTCDQAIIYGLTNGTKTSIVECLETRGKNFSGDFNGSSTVESDELATVTSIAKEAFMNCDNVEEVLLDSSSVAAIPERCFAGTSNLNTVKLSDSTKNIQKDAFLDSNIRKVNIPNSNCYIADEYVFGQTQNGWNSSNETVEGYVSTTNPYVTPDTSVSRNITFYTPADSFASGYAGKENGHAYINATATTIPHTVTFKDPENTDTPIYWTEDVEEGKCATLPPTGNPSHDDMTFVGWMLDGEVVDVETTAITADTTYVAKFEGSTTYVTVTFYTKAGSDGEVWGDPQTIIKGTNASTPTSPTRDGYTFTGWWPEYTNVTEDLNVYGQWEKIDSSDKWTVNFYDYDENIVSCQLVADGEDATTPTTPTKSGYTFVKWLGDYTNVTSDLDIYSQWTQDSSSGGGSSGGGSGTTSGNGTTVYNVTISGNSSTATHTVTVLNGSGSGTYAEGTTVIISAIVPNGKAFSKWVTSDATLNDATATATIFKMPSKDVVVTAQLTDSGSTTVKTATGNASRPSSTVASTTGSTSASAAASTPTGNTSVIVNKGGVSNTNVASATVHGSTDSFVVKVTETNESTTQVETALKNRYGSLDSLKYWACDITLYDSTGSSKITDTSGLTVDVTLPIPDELQQYGGNNMAGAVKNNNLEDLDVKFNTINGTPTMTFTATHFSPYVIYTDLNHQDASLALDSSPKTGDPIHPKWFLAMALACASIVLFFMKDKRKVRTAAA